MDRKYIVYKLKSKLVLEIIPLSVCNDNKY